MRSVRTYVLNSKGEFEGVGYHTPGDFLLRVGLVDGSEHHIAVPENTAYSTRDGMLQIGQRKYGTWAWIDSARYKASSQDGSVVPLD